MTGCHTVSSEFQMLFCNYIINVIFTKTSWRPVPIQCSHDVNSNFYNWFIISSTFLFTKTSWRPVPIQRRQNFNNYFTVVSLYYQIFFNLHGQLSTASHSVSSEFQHIICDCFIILSMYRQNKFLNITWIQTTLNKDCFFLQPFILFLFLF